MTGWLCLGGAWLAIVGVTVDGWRHPERARRWLLVLLVAPVALGATSAGPPAILAAVAALSPHRVDPAIRATLLAGAISEAANGAAFLCVGGWPALLGAFLLAVSARRGKAAGE